MFIAIIPDVGRLNLMNVSIAMIVVRVMLVFNASVCVNICHGSLLTVGTGDTDNGPYFQLAVGSSTLAKNPH